MTLTFRSKSELGESWYVDYLTVLNLAIWTLFSPSDPYPTFLSLSTGPIFISSGVKFCILSGCSFFSAFLVSLSTCSFPIMPWWLGIQYQIYSMTTSQWIEQRFLDLPNKKILIRKVSYCDETAFRVGVNTFIYFIYLFRFPIAMRQLLESE